MTSTQKKANVFLKRELELSKNAPNGWYTYGEPYNNTITNGYRRNGAIDTAYTEFVSYILENEANAISNGRSRKKEAR